MSMDASKFRWYVKSCLLSDLNRAKNRKSPTGKYAIWQLPLANETKCQISANITFAHEIDQGCALRKMSKCLHGWWPHFCVYMKIETQTNAGNMLKRCRVYYPLFTKLRTSYSNNRNRTSARSTTSLKKSTQNSFECFSLDKIWFPVIFNFSWEKKLSTWKTWLKFRANRVFGFERRLI